MKNKTNKLLEWHNILLNEARIVAYRLSGDREVSEEFLEDFAFSLESLSHRVRRETCNGN